MRDLFSDLFWVEYLVPFGKREKVQRTLSVLFAVSIGLLFVLYLFDLLVLFSPIAPAIALFLFLAWASGVLLRTYLASRERELSLSHFFAGVLARGADTDAVLAFVESEIGLKILALARVPLAAVEGFKEQRAGSRELAPRVLSLAASRDLRVRLSEMYRDDSRFSAFLAVNGVSLPELLLAADLFLKDGRLRRMPRARFMPKGAFYLRGIGKRWSIGNAPTLHSYEKDLPKMVFPHKDELKALLPALEEAYIHSRSAKVALHGEAERVRELLVLFAEKAKRGDVHASLAARYPLILDTNMIVGRARDRAALEETLAHTVNEAIRAGIFLLIIEDWDLFLKSCASFGVEARHIFDPLFTSSRVAILLSGFSGSGAVSFDVTPRAPETAFQVPDALIRSGQ
ncbi:MAG: hypothetical protein V4674_01115 [Patescibacteria group bacterium]